MSNRFVVNGNTIRISSGLAEVHNSLTVGTYTIMRDQFGDFFLEQSADLRIPSRIYGDTNWQANRIMTTFEQRERSTGVLLCGHPGSGKTMLAKVLSNECANRGIPTLLVNASYHGTSFNSFLQLIEQPVMVLFDEFEKTYDSEEQESLLTLFDGVFENKKLYVLTANASVKIVKQMKNRPGRLYYNIEFKGLPKGFIQEYCEINLKNQKFTEEIQKMSRFVNEFSFDMLQALVEESNRYDEKPMESVFMLNVKASHPAKENYLAKIILDKKPFDNKFLATETYYGDPFHPEGIYMRGVITDPHDSEKEQEVTWFFMPSDLTDMEVEKGLYHFVNSDGVELILTQIKPVERNFSSFMAY